MNSIRNNKFLFTAMVLVAMVSMVHIGLNPMTVPQVFSPASKATYTALQKSDSFDTFDNSWQLPTAGAGSIYFTVSSPGDILHDIMVLFSPVLGIAGSNDLGGREESNFRVALIGWSGNMSVLRLGHPISQYPKSLYFWPDESTNNRVERTMYVPAGQQDRTPPNVLWRILRNLQNNQNLNILIHYGAGIDSGFEIYVQETTSANLPWNLILSYKNTETRFTLPTTSKYFSLSSWNNNLEYSDIRVGLHPIEYVNKLQVADKAVTDLIFALCSTNQTTAANAYVQAMSPTTVAGSSTSVPYYQTLTTDLQNANNILSAFKGPNGSIWGNLINSNPSGRYPRPTIPTNTTLPRNIRLATTFYVDPAMTAEHPDITALNAALTNPALQAMVISADQQLAQTLQAADSQVIQLITQLANPATRATAQQDALTLGAPSGITNNTFNATLPYFKNLINALQSANDAIKTRSIAQAVAAAFTRPVIAINNPAPANPAPANPAPANPAPVNPYSAIIASISTTLFNPAASHPDGIALKQAVDQTLALTLQTTNAAVIGLTAQLNDPAQQSTALAAATAVQSNRQTYAQLISSYLQDANNKIADYPEAKALATAAAGSVLYVEGAATQPSLFANTANAHPDSVALATAVSNVTSIITATNTTLARELQEADTEVITLLQQITNPDTKDSALTAAIAPNVNGVKRYLSLAEGLHHANSALNGNAGAIAIANRYPRAIPAMPNVTLASTLYVDPTATPQHPDAAALISVVTNALANGFKSIPNAPENNAVIVSITGQSTPTDLTIESTEPPAKADGTIEL